MDQISNRMGLHIEGGTAVPLVSPTGVQPTIVTATNISALYAKRLREIIGPDALMLIRFTERDQDLSNPVENAWTWYTKRFAQMFDISLVAGRFAVIGYNEVPRAQYAAYALFEEERIRLMHLGGFPVGAFSFSTGTPEPEDWAIFARAIAALRPASDCVVVHEYAPTVNQIDNMAYIGRVFCDAALRALDGQQVVVAETGADHVPDKNLPIEEQGAAGWKRTMTPDEYLYFLFRLDWRYQALSDLFPQIKLVGWTVYGVGGFDWEYFDVTELWSQVVKAYTAPDTWAPPVTPVGGSLGELATFSRWYVEESTRLLEDAMARVQDPKLERAARTLKALIDLERGAMYKVERALAG